MKPLACSSLGLSVCAKICVVDGQKTTNNKVTIVATIIVVVAPLVAPGNNIAQKAQPGLS
jgi:hypothetical protein